MDTEFIETNLPCPDCGSSDALGRNADGSTKCFSCEEFTPRPSEANMITINKKPTTTANSIPFIMGEVLPIAPRGIHLDTCLKYCYEVGENEKGEPVHCANYKDDDGRIIGQKIRGADKNFSIRGKINDRFYGQHIWKNGGNKLLIVEGEIDCLTASQLQSNKYPVVSLSQGVNSAKNLFKKNLKWLESFKEVILMFDEDEAGQKAVADVVGILSPGKTFVARLSGKDPNAMLMDGRGDEVVKAMWEAKKWSPANIVDGADLFEEISAIKLNDSIPYPFEGLNTKTRGMRKGEIITFCAGSGIGKSQVCRQIAHHILTTTNKKVGYIALEESIERTAQGILGLELKKLLHLEAVEVDEEYHRAFQKTVGSSRLLLYDHWGSLDATKILGDVRYMAQAMDVEYIILDHISIVVSGMQESDMGNERKAIDVIMTRLRALVEETGLALLLVSHLKRPEGRKGHEEGVAVSLSHLRGSASLAQLSDMVVGLERDQQDPEEKHLTTMRVLKNRFSGETGIAGWLNFDPDTGILSDSDKENPF
tara:strand:- start:717 stop:2327 length:1611 start_codon:yes stop_codon:yes gene_type:complete